MTITAPEPHGAGRAPHHGTVPPVKLWLCPNDALPPAVAQVLAEHWLDERETETMARFLFERDRRQYLVAHTLVRRALALEARPRRGGAGHLAFLARAALPAAAARRSAPGRRTPGLQPLPRGRLQPARHRPQAAHRRRRRGPRPGAAGSGDHPDDLRPRGAAVGGRRVLGTAAGPPGAAAVDAEGGVHQGPRTGTRSALRRVLPSPWPTTAGCSLSGPRRRQGRTVAVPGTGAGTRRAGRGGRTRGRHPGPAPGVAHRLPLGPGRAAPSPCPSPWAHRTTDLAPVPRQAGELEPRIRFQVRRHPTWSTAGGRVQEGARGDGHG